MKSFLSLAGAALVFGACATATAGRPALACPCPLPLAEWEAMLRDAATLADSGEFAQADSVIVAFAAEHPDTQHARETVFLRALYWLDPRNPEPRRSEAIAVLDEYMASGSLVWYRSEARVVRQLAYAAAAPPQVVVVPGQTPPIQMPAEAKDLEIQQLRAQNARLNEELERIKRRLSTP